MKLSKNGLLQNEILQKWNTEPTPEKQSKACTESAPPLFSVEF